MLTTLEAVYDNGVIIFDKKPPIDKKVKVLITFLEDTQQLTKKKKRKAGGLKGQIWMSDSFDEPLDDLKDYM